MKLPFKSDLVGCVSVLNDQFVLLCCSKVVCALRGRVDIITDDIWIYNVKTATFRKSSIRFPPRMNTDLETSCQVFTVDNSDKDQMTVFGYVRREWKKAQIDQKLFPPEYLVRIMV